MHQAALGERKLVLLWLLNRLQPNPTHFSVILKGIQPSLMFYFLRKQYLISKSHVDSLYVLWVKYKHAAQKRSEAEEPNGRQNLTFFSATTPCFDHSGRQEFSKS